MSTRMREKIDRSSKRMIETIDSINVDSIQLDGVTMRVGNKVVRLVVDESSPLEIEEQIRNEYKEKLTSKLLTIKERINIELDEMSKFVTSLKNEYLKKEAEITRRLSDSILMPNITEDHMKRGLSVCRGRSGGEINWLVQGIYWPRFFNRRAIEPNYTKKMMSHIIILIKTKGDNIVGVSTRRPLGMDYFQHYHQSNPDCWGQWKYPRKFDGNPDTIIKIAQEAQIVLENINQGSIAKDNPRGLPRKTTLMRHLLPDGEGVDDMKNLRQDVRRMGIRRPNDAIDENTFWSS